MHVTQGFQQGYTQKLQLPKLFQEIYRVLLMPENSNLQFQLYSARNKTCLLYTSPSPRDRTRSRMPSSA
jgi:hypothetical protein